MTSRRLTSLTSLTSLTWLACPLVISLLAQGEAWADASPGAKKKAAPRSKPLPLAARLRSLLPPGWQLQTKGLPKGIEGVALGPKTKEGRAVVTLSRLASEPDPEELASREARAFVVEQVDASPELAATRPVAASAASAASTVRDVSEFGAEAASGSAGDREVRYLISSGKPSYLLTIVAPKKSFDRTYRQIVALATRLRRSTSRR